MESQAAPLEVGLRVRLSVMMFLQYAIWGAWLPLLWPFLAGHRGFSANQIGNMFAVGAVGAIVAPFIAGQIADRWFATEKYLALSHALGGVLIWQLASLESYGQFLAFSLAYSLLYSPTMPLTNSLAFHHLPDRDRDFGRVRVWGTVGWIAVGIGIGQWLLYRHTPSSGSAQEILAAQSAGMADAFRLSAALGLFLGGFCLLLPHTPPKQGDKSFATAEALGEIKRQPLLTLFLLAVPISCIHQFYFVHTAPFLGAIQARLGDGTGAAVALGEWINRFVGVGGGGLMTLGQMSELVVLSAVPLFARRFHRKTLLCVGTLAYAARMALFAFAAPIASATGLSEVLVAAVGVTLHGPVFAFWIFLAFLIVDEETTGDVRASAQSLFNLVIVGVGVIVGSKIAAWVSDWATVDGTLDYTRLFGVPMWASLACLVVLLVAYPGGRRASTAVSA
ncbi:MAG TPA: MFS transporter [Planctomycetota bacterium]|nr:MFS transporter [Planctomycetota bacterium]